MNEKTPRKEKLVTKDYLVLIYVNLFIAINLYISIVITSEYAIKTFAAPTALAGFATSSFTIGAIMTRFVAGKVLIMAGYKRTLICGCLLSVMVSAAYLIKISIVFLIAVRILHGVSFALFTTATSTILAETIPVSRRGEGIGYFSLSQTLAAAVGPWIALAISKGGNYSLIYALSTGFAVICLLSSFAVKDRTPVYTAAQRDELRGFNLSSFLDFQSFKISLTSLFSYICYGALISFMAVYTRQTGLEAAASYFFVFYAAAAMISRPSAGRIFDRKGENFIIYPGVLALTAGLAFFAFAEKGFMILIAAFMVGLGLGCVQSGVQTLVVKVTPSYRLGPANSTFFLCTDSGNGIGPLLMGILIPYLGYRGIYIMLVFISSFVLFVYWAGHGRKA